MELHLKGTCQKKPNRDILPLPRRRITAPAPLKKPLLNQKPKEPILKTPRRQIQIVNPPIPEPLPNFNLILLKQDQFSVHLHPLPATAHTVIGQLLSIPSRSPDSPSPKRPWPSRPLARPTPVSASIAPPLYEHSDAGSRLESK